MPNFLVLTLTDLYDNISACVDEEFAHLIIEYIASRMHDEVFIRNAGMNLLLHDRDANVKRRLREFISILKAISDLPKGSYALIKVRPFISNIWNDVDLLVDKEKLTQVINILKRWSISKVIYKRGKGLTFYLRNTSLQIDLYTHIAWRELKYLEPGLISEAEITEFPIADGTKIRVYVLPLFLDLTIQALHVFASGTLTLSDMLKLLCFRNVREEEIKQRLKLYVKLDDLLGYLKYVMLVQVDELLKRGYAKLPVNPVLKLYLIFNNLKHHNFDFRGYYYELKDIVRKILVK